MPTTPKLILWFLLFYIIFFKKTIICVIFIFKNNFCIYVLINTPSFFIVFGLFNPFEITIIIFIILSVFNYFYEISVIHFVKINKLYFI